MSDDYKKDILNYITNMINQTEPTTEEIVKEIIELDRSKWTPYLPSSWYLFNFEGLIPANELTSGLTILYGGYVVDNPPTTTSGKGIIILLDQNFEPVKSFYNYDSGTTLRYIQQMEQAEDGSFYMVDDTQYSDRGATGSTSQKRFVMLNNFTIPNANNEYVLRLRTSYIMQSPYNTFYCRYITKNPNSAHYLMAGYTNNTQAIMEAIELKINVGEANEWTLYSIPSTQQVIKQYCTAIAMFDSDDNVKFRLLYTDTNNVLSQMYKDYSSTVYSTSVIFNSSIDGFGYPYGQQFVFPTYDKCYFVSNNQLTGDSTGYLILYKYDFNTSSITTIYNKNTGSGGTLKEAINLYVLNGELYVQFNNNIDTTNYKADYYIQRLTDDVWGPILIAENKGYLVGYRRIFARQTFNVLQIYLYPTSPGWTGYQCLIKENYNPLIYNGESYTDYNSTIPQQAEVYNGESLVFARNLYNLTTNDNQTNATVVVPNPYLNGIDLTNQNLLSETNTGLIYNANTITKNIYETLFLNFITTLNVKDTDTNTNYPTTASYITTNINTGTQANCENTFVGKARINFSGGSSRVQTMLWETIDDFNKQTSFALYIAEPISTIDLISDDELVTYMTIDASTMEVNKTYLVTQKLGIE